MRHLLGQLSGWLVGATASMCEVSAISRVNDAITANFLGLSTAPPTARLRTPFALGDPLPGGLGIEEAAGNSDRSVTGKVTA
jgi:hypothetical protein